jgi:hypothetical protein
MYQVTFNITADDGSVYDTTDAWIEAHGPCGTINEDFVSEGAMTLIEGGNGVTVVLKYADESKYQEHIANPETGLASQAGITLGDATTVTI